MEDVHEYFRYMVTMALAAKAYEEHCKIMGGKFTAIYIFMHETR